MDVFKGVTLEPVTKFKIARKLVKHQWLDAKDIKLLGRLLEKY